MINDYVIEVSDENNMEVKSKYKGHERNGMYHLVLNPGTYTLNFKINNSLVKKETITIGDELEIFDNRL